METKRPSTPPLQQQLVPPQTPGAALPHTTIPPSPGEGNARGKAVRLGLSTAPLLRAPPASSKRSTASGVRKAGAKTGNKGIEVRQIKGKEVEKRKTSLLDMPGEIRNLIYDYTFTFPPRQALLVHRPRLATLRPRTRMDRYRRSPSDTQTQSASTKPAQRAPRTTNRPFSGLTQTNHTLRKEYLPLYQQHQEIGLDLVDTASYLSTFYPTAPTHLQHLSTARASDRKLDLPLTGNLTIAVGAEPRGIEKTVQGVDIHPLLSLWANSFRIEAGFGRYLRAGYDAAADGEAKDLYRLFGRRVLADRRCSGMNALWRAALRARALGAVRVHRGGGGEGRPWLEVLYRREWAEEWMLAGRAVERGWLEARGFGGMEFFEVRVGVEGDD